MWDKPQLLMWFANLLTALAVLLLFYSLVFLGVHSPLFPVKRIKVDGDLAHVTREQLQYVIRNDLKGTFFLRWIWTRRGRHLKSCRGCAR